MRETNNESRWKRLLFSLLAMLLVFSAVSPPLAFAVDTGMTTVTSTTKHTTVNTINTEGFQMTLKLADGKRWASDVKNKEQLFVDDIQANEQKDQWTAYKDRNAIRFKRESSYSTADIYTNADRSELTVIFPADARYDLTTNQLLTMSINPALIEEWPGEVTPVSFMVYAKPQIALGGSITNDTTLEDIQKGGKEIELRLLNAKWNSDHITKITNFNKLLDSFIVSGTSSVVWDVAKSLKNTDPNKVISYSEDMRTLKMKLPPIASTSFDTIQLTVPSEFYTIEKIDLDGNLSVIGPDVPGNRISATALTFRIGSQAIPGMEPLDDLTEDQLKRAVPATALRATLHVKLRNAKFDLSTNEKKILLLDSIQAKSQNDQWELIRKELTPATIQEQSDGSYKIIFPRIEQLYLVKDMELTLNIPYQLLEKDVKIPEQRFTIKAQPKVLLSGTATPTITQTDFAKGGKRLVLTLVKSEWQSDVATNTKKREDLLKTFNWPVATQSEILARADVKRTNSSTVTITLPAISQKYSGTVHFTSGLLTGRNLLQSDREFLNEVHAFNVTSSTDQLAVITGTATINSNDLDIVKGNKTVVISLKNDKWKLNLTDLIAYHPIQVVTENGKSLDYTIVRTNDTTATLKLKANASFLLKSDQNVKVSIPDTLLGVRSSGPLQVERAFKIHAVTASLSGTGISLNPLDVQTGGKTIVVTLNNAEFKDSLSVAEVRAMFTSRILPWTFSLADFTVAKNKLTIKLPAVPSYPLSETQFINLNIKSSVLKEYSDISPTVDRTVEGAVSIGGGAWAIIGQSSMLESDVRAGNHVLTITLTDAEWDPAIVTNAAKKSALLKGFAVSDQTKEWGVATSTIAKDGKFYMSGKTLVIEFPKNPNYSIVRDQIVTVTVPKAVLKNYIYDIEAKQKLVIAVPTIESASSFEEVVQSGLASYIEMKGLHNLRVAVPKKVVRKISTYAATLGDNTLTTIEVETEDSVNKVIATISSEKNEVEKELVTKVGNTFTFVFDDIQPNSTLQIDVYANSSELVQSSFTKIAKGNKVFTDAPKSSLEGSYTLYSLLTEKNLLSDILKYYSLADLKIGTVNEGW